ncbi:MAG: ribosome small subunit-dependent GTPase A [Gemmatimonadota bacterium]
MSDESRGVVHETRGGNYSIVLDDGRRVEASLRGRLKRQERTGQRVVIGDRVRVEQGETAWTIEEVAERDTELVRRGRGRAPKILAANLDRVFVIVALRDPKASPQLIDRLLVLVEASGMHPMLVLNKVDLDETAALADSYVELYERVGYAVLITSAESGAGLPELHDQMCSGSSAFIGPSGVGKSSLLNAIDPALGLRTGELSRKTGTGRHTTVGSRMLPLACGGLVADTPGFGDVGLWAVQPEDVGFGFPEIADREPECRFRGCAHLAEPDCAVRTAVEDGEIAESRYESYRVLREEAASAGAR